MKSEHPSDIGHGSSRGDSVSAARGNLRDALGTLRNLAELLRSPRVAPKAVSSVLPDVLDAFAPMREASRALLEGLSGAPALAPGRLALQEFLLPRLSLLEQTLREATPKPMSAASRLRLETLVGSSSLELDSARELLQLLEESASARSTPLDPIELVREAFAAPPSVRGDAREPICAVLASRAEGLEIDANPRVAMTLVALAVELVAARQGTGEPTLFVSADRRGGCRVQIARRPHATGEPLVLVPRGVIAPTLACLQAAARAGGGGLEWDESSGAALLRYRGPFAAQHQAG